MQKFVPRRPGRRAAVPVWVALVASCAMIYLPGIQQNGSAQQKVHLNPLIARLQQGQPAFMGEVWQFIDMQHGVFSLDRLQVLLGEFEKRKKPNGQFEMAPIVRIPMQGHELAMNGWAVQQVLERGAMGIIFPEIETKAQAAGAIRAMRRLSRPPRLWGIKDPNAFFGQADIWPLNPDGELLAVIMIESREGVKNVNEILEVPGIGAINVGPGDLSRSLGVRPPGPDGYAPETEAAAQTVLQACKAHKVPCFLGGRVDVKQRLAEGWKILFADGARVIS